MATFVKCKEDFVVSKRMKQIQVDSKLTTFLFFFKRLEPVYNEVPDNDKKHFNNPVNLDMVFDIEKITGNGDVRSDGTVIDGTSKPGIKFHFKGAYTKWFYLDEKTRDEQLEEIVSNSHIYKSKVVL